MKVRNRAGVVTILLFLVEVCGDNLTASLEQNEYEIAQPEYGRTCVYSISTTPGHGISLTIAGAGNRNYTGDPELCNEVTVTVTSSVYCLFFS